MRIQVNISDEMVKSLDEMSKKMGMSRSAFCAYIIGEKMMAYNASMDAAQNVLQRFADKALNAKI